MVNCQLELVKSKPDEHDSFGQNGYNEDHGFYGFGVMVMAANTYAEELFEFDEVE